MMKLKIIMIIFIIYLFVISAFLCGCTPVTVDNVIDLNRERYVSKIDPLKFEQYHGKRILLSSIQDQSDNNNFYYYNPQRTIGYKLNYSDSSMQQPIASYYWYALKKAFQSAGIKVVEHSPYYDAELTLILHSLTDEEIQFEIDLIKSDKLTYNKYYVVRLPTVESSNAEMLEKRAYAMLDSIVTTILNDPDFQKALLTPFVDVEQKYKNIEGVVLYNGEVIRGEIIEMNTDIIKIRAKNGSVMSYSFIKEVESLIKK